VGDGVGVGAAVGAGDEVGGPGSDRTGDGGWEAGRVGVDGEDGGTWWDDGSPGCVAPVDPGGTVKALAGACPAVPGAVAPGACPGAADPGGWPGWL
jgi:hypothetical protein